MKFRNYLIVTIGIGLSTFFLWPKLRTPNPTSNIGQAEIGSTAAISPPAAGSPVAFSSAQEREKRILGLQEKIQVLSKEIIEIDEDLRQRGFPQVFLDERLSESERSDLLGKIASVTKLQINVAKLKTQKVDLQTEDSL